MQAYYLKIVPPVSSPLFKYIEERYAVTMLKEGEIKLGSLYKYRTHWNDQIRDTDEGTYTVQEQLSGTTKSLTGLAAEFIKVEDGVNFSMEGGTFIKDYEIPNANVYCLTREGSKEVMEQFEADACIEITDVNGFFNAVLSALQVKRISLGGFVDTCIYDGRIVDYKERRSATGVAKGYWLKAPSYAHQKEVRLVVDRYDPKQIVEDVIIKVPEIIPLLKRRTF